MVIHSKTEDINGKIRDEILFMEKINSEKLKLKFYHLGSDVPFTWKIDEETQGSFKNGKRYGFWLPYWDNGQLMIKVNHKNGILEGSKV